jgi:predicted Zn-dependent protease with MMP-like domain
MVSVFGSIFNALEVVKTDAAGKVLQKIKVPLAYGPRQKFLSRASDLTDSKIAIKLPRLSFEITDMSYDGAAKLNKNRKYIKTDPLDKKNVKSLGVPAVYKVGFELNIMAKAQDDALQILEQILPMFQPEYTVTIKDIPDMDITSDVPIVLTDVSLNDEYEGDFLSRRTIVYTLTFETRVRFYRGIQERSVIDKTEVYYKDGNTNKNIEVQKVDGTTTPYTETIDFFNEP